MNRKVVIAGSIAQRQSNGGHAWVFLQYLLGFRKLGYEVLFLDRLEPDMSQDSTGVACGFAESSNLQYLRELMHRFDLNHAWSLFCESGRPIFGRSRADVLRHVRESQLFLNVMGFFDDADVLRAAPLKAFLDIDPGFGQMWRELGLHDLFQNHDAYITIGQNIGKPGCEIPTCGIDWITTPQPVVLDEWPVSRGNNGKFTGISTWRGPFGPVEFNGKIYGLRVHEFRKLASLPARSKQKFELALDIHPTETKDIELLKSNGWQLINPQSIAATTDDYRSYVQSSMAELMIAKNMYVQSRGGWFSDRSICYLASGKPVLAQDTGLAGLYPTASGLVTFNTIDEAIEGADKIASDYERHTAAARRIAEEHFDSDKVLANLLKQLQVRA